MVRGTPCKRTTSLKKRSAVWLASFVLVHGMKCAILENLSTTTKIESLCSILGKPSTKSIDRSTHGVIGIGKGILLLSGKPSGTKPDKEKEYNIILLLLMADISLNRKQVGWMD
ncbi:hypothetical protein YC2023_082732 [Brassica napus]